MAVRPVSEDEGRALSYGKTIPAAGIGGTHAALAADGSVVALLLEDGDRAKPILVFTPAG
jgi:tRNA pseudouridine55 synthase